MVVELKARFDEAANIQWASRLEERRHPRHATASSGSRRTARSILVVRQDYDGLRRYAHIGTGNYHAGTARLYTDLGLLTCDDAIGRDLTELFNYLTTGYKPQRALPQAARRRRRVLKQALLEKIEREIAQPRAERPGLIQFKMNALEDADITRALYRASQAGVRDRPDRARHLPPAPGLPGPVRERSACVSIVGRFLEHARIYYFRNGGERGVLHRLGRLMKRNLESRVEVRGAGRGSGAARASCARILDAQLTDQRERLGHAARRQLRAAPAAQRSRGDRLAAGPDRGGRTAPLRGEPAAQAQAALDRRASPRRGLTRRAGARRPHQRPASASSIVAALRRSRARSPASRLGSSVRTTPARPTMRGSDSAIGPTPSTSSVTHRDRERRVSSPPIDWTMRARPPAMPYQVAPLPSMMR